MSSEQLADGVNPLDAELAATWDVLKGYSGRDTDLGIARRFGGAAAAYSLRDIGAMNGSVVRVRREPNDTTAGIDDEERFSANQVQDGTLERWVNGELESTLPADVATAAAAYSLRKVKSDYGAPTTKLDGSDGFPSNLNSLPLNDFSNAISGSTFTVGHFSVNSGAADSVSLSLGNNSFILRADKATSGAGYGHAIRVKGLSVGKRYTVTGECRLIRGNESGGTKANIDISDTTPGTDEKAFTTTNSEFTAFEVSSVFNDSTSGINFIDFSIVDFSGANAGSGLIEAEFRNIKIVESDNRVVRLRRSSDNVEVDVDFDTEGKLSTSSLVGDIAEQGGESGSTTATDLDGFLNESNVNVGMGNTFFDQNDQVDIAGASATGFTATVAKNNTSDIDVRAGGQGYDNVKKGTITLSYNVVQNTFSTSFTVQLWQLVSGEGYKIVDTVPSGTTGARTITFENTNTAGSIVRFVAPDHLVNDGEVLQISDLSLTASKHTATVHTWYDQAGSNDAIMGSATNQPRIAENGALLADGIDFDGTNDFLESTTLTSIYTGTDTVSSAFVVVNSDVASTTQYIIGAGNTSLSNPMYNTLFHSGGNIGWQARDDSGTLKSNLTATPYEADKMYLVSNINSGTTTDFNTNSVIEDNGADSDLGAKTINTVKLGARGNASSSPLNGSMKEAIFYASDQSDNRFKIESNINNYYGLYNDENEWDLATNPAWTSNASSGFTANGTDGFTITTSGTSIQQFKLRVPTTESPTDSDYFKVSFNNNDPDGLITNSQLRITSFGSGGSATTISNGFNALDIINNGGFTFAYFSINADGGGSSKTATISNFKISRIARNGFVETWYDQSGNGNDASKSVADNQPKIVKNGGQLRLENKTPAVGFDRNPSFSQLSIGTPLANEPYTFFATTVHNGAFYFRLFGNNNLAPTIILNSASGGSLTYTPSGSDASGILSTSAVLSDNIVSGFSGVNGGADGIVRINGTNLKTDISRTQAADSITTIGRFPNTSTTLSCIESLVIYESDLTSDFDAIEKELAQPINIL